MCLPVPETNLSLCQRGIYYASVKIYNQLPKYVVDSTENKKQFIGKL